MCMVRRITGHLASAWRLSGVSGAIRGYPIPGFQGDLMQTSMETACALGVCPGHHGRIQVRAISMSAHSQQAAANFGSRQIDADEVMVWVRTLRNLSEWTPSKRIAAEPNGMGQSRETWEAPDAQMSPCF